MTRQYELLIFDWDGTLMDSVDHIVSSLSAAANDLGMEDLGTHRYRDIIGLGLVEAMHALYPGATTQEQTSLCDRYRHHFLDESKATSRLFDGAHDMLTSLHEKGLKMAIATGKARIGLNRVFKDTGYDSLFHTSRCADESGSKPHPKMLHEILDEMAVPAERAIMIGDTIYDMQMARNAGVAGLAVSYGVHDCEQLEQHAPVACCHSIDELRVWLHTHSS